MYSKQLEELIEAALIDGVLTEKEKQILFKKAKAEGIDLDEFEMVLNARALKATQVQQPAHQTKEKKGNIITCPNCGAHVSALAGVCPECGHEFTGIKANSSARLLADKLEKVTPNVGKRADEDDKQASIWNQMATIVSSFPIPNAKDDLFEFAVSMKTKMTIKLGGIASTSKDAGATLMAAYLNKYQESMMKIMTLYSADHIFSDLIGNYKNDVKKAKKAIWWQGHGDNFKWILGFVSWFVILGIIFAVLAIKEERDFAKIDAQYECLLNQINALPVPTKNNCDECTYAIQKIDWQVQYSGSDKFAKDEMTKRKAFYERKNAYIDLLQKQGAKIEKVEIPEESESLLDKLF